MWLFRTFGALPEPGALGDQPAGVLSQMRHAEQVYDVCAGYYQAHDLSKWSRSNPGALKLKLAIDEMRGLK